MRKSFKANKKNNDGENLKRHFDLKYQIQYIISTGVLITIIFSFIGFSTKEDIEKRVTRSTSGIDSLENRISNLYLSFNKYRSIVNEVIGIDSAKLKILEADINNANISLSTFKTDINATMRELDIPRYNIVEGINLVTKGFYFSDKTGTTIYFNKLRTKKGNPLPKFYKTPTVFVHSNDLLIIKVMKVTEDYIILKALDEPQILKTGETINDRNYKIDILLID